MRMILTIMLGLLWVGGILSQPAWAGDSPFPNNVNVEGGNPDFILVDTDLNATDWALEGDEPCPNCFDISPLDTNTTPFVIESGTGSSLLYLDSAERIGINTNVPVEELDIHSTLPAIRLDDTSASAGRVDLQMSTNEFTIEGNNDQDIFEIDTRAPADSLNINDIGRVGIGTQSPGGNLHIFGDATTDVFSGVGPDLVNGPALNFGYSGGSFGRGSGFFNVRPDGLATGVNPSLRFATSNVQRLVITNTGRVGIGTLAPTQELDVSGNIRASGSFISGGTTLSVPDYVFEADYALPPLTELAAYVKREKHLPDMPSAAEIKGQGLNIGEFQMSLLKKVEELTLYTLEQEQTLHAQAETIQQLSARLAALE